jgi:EmrB/QacA subfamily drug resistance transporter
MKGPCDLTVMLVGDGGAACGPRAKGWVLAATILGSSLAFIDGTVVNVALPALQSSFHATVVDVQWVVEAYGLFLGALILVGGSLGDVFGRRKVFVAGVAIFAAASGACGAAPTVQWLVIARSVQGVGAALLVPGSLAIISSAFDEKGRGQAIGTWSGFTAMTTAVGPVLGGWLVQHASWRWVFFINLPLAAMVIAISLWQVPESRGTGRRVDWLGAVLGTTGLAGLIIGLIESVNWGWQSFLVWGSLAVGVACLAIFMFAESRVDSPMLPLELFKSRSFSGANLLTLFLYSALGIFFFLFPMNLIQVQGYSSTRAGAAMLPLILLMFSLSRWSGGLVARYGARGPLIIGPLIAGIGFALFAVPGIGGNYWTAFFPAIMVLGFGMAVTVAPLTTSVMNAVQEDRVGSASGINNAVARVAGVLAIAVFGIVMVKAFGDELNRELEHVALPAGVAHAITAEGKKLAGLPIPPELDANTGAAVKRAVGDAFIFGYRIVMWLCAVLGFMSAAVAWGIMPKTGTVERDPGKGLV